MISAPALDSDLYRINAHNGIDEYTLETVHTANTNILSCKYRYYFLSNIDMKAQSLVLLPKRAPCYLNHVNVSSLAWAQICNIPADVNLISGAISGSRRDISRPKSSKIDQVHWMPFTDLGSGPEFWAFRLT